MKQLLHDLWDGEPVLVLALGGAIINFAVLFTDWDAAIKAAAVGIITVLSAFYARSKVTPV